MKTTITLKKPEIDQILSGAGFTLTLANGQEIIIRADGKAPARIEKEITFGVENPSGEFPVLKLRRTLKRRGGRRKAGARGRKRRAASQEQRDIFFSVLKESGNLKEAYQAAGVSDVTGYKWRKELNGQAPRRRTTGASKRHKPRAASRAFVHQTPNAFLCRPEDFRESALNSEERRVFWILCGREGKEAVIDAKAIAVRADFEGSQASRKVRAVIHRLRDEKHLAIASCSQGYYMAATEEELEEFLRLMKDRGLSSLSIVAKFKKVTLPAYCGQLSLEVG